MRMTGAIFSVLLLPGAAPAAEPVAAPQDFRLEVQSYSGNCAIITVRRRDESVAFHGDLGCHGWSADWCGETMFLRRAGVVADGGIVLPRRAGQPTDIPAIINAELARRSPHREYLHLILARSRCTMSGFVIPFEGSSIGRGEQGPATEMQGVVTIQSDGRHSVRFEGQVDRTGADPDPPPIADRPG